MSDDLWIEIPNWRKFQHYSDRTPPWIKLYVELRDKREWEDMLNDAQRGLLVRCWLEYAACHGPYRASRVRPSVGQRYFQGNLKSLSDAGFIRLSASKPLALREEKKREEGLASKPASKPPSQATFEGGFEPEKIDVDSQSLAIAKDFLQKLRGEDVDEESGDGEPRNPFL